MPITHNATTTKLRRLLTYFENGAASIRMTLTFLENDPTAPRTGRPKNSTNGHGGMPPVMRDALAMYESRPAKEGKKVSKAKGAKKAPGSHHKALIKRRTETAKVLGLFKGDNIVTAKEMGHAQGGRVSITSLTRWGYIKKKGEGYIRTAKPFSIDPKENGPGKD